MPERMGVAYWPGVSACVSCQYTVSHDVGAGVASLEIPEQDLGRVAGYGDLVITDGVGTVTLRRARVVDVRFAAAGGPRTVVLSIADRRWMWRFGRVRGRWNQPDPFPDPDLFPPGEYVLPGGPYAAGTYRTLRQLVEHCLEQMGERRPSGAGAGTGGRGPVDPPAGAGGGAGGAGRGGGPPGEWAIEPGPDGRALDEPVPAAWDEENPAQALTGVAADLGYRLVYQPNADRALVAPAGFGAPLPTGLPRAAAGAAVDLPGRPAALRLVGGPTVWQDWLALEPVGLEKDGTVRPIDQLSYAPRAPRAAVWEFAVDRLSAADPYGVTVTVAVGGVATATTFTAAYTAPQSELPLLTSLAAQITADAFLSAHVRAEVVAQPYVGFLGDNFTRVLRVTGLTPQTVFRLDTTAFTRADTREVRAADPDRRAWEDVQPPYFRGLEATADTTAEEATDLARRHVWQTFRVKMADVQDLSQPGPNVGGFGRVNDRTEIVLGDRVYDGTRAVTGRWAAEPAFCFGTVYVTEGEGTFPNGSVDNNGNTLAGRRLPFRPQFDAERGLVTFDRCLFYRDPDAGRKPVTPDLWVYTSFTLRSVVGRAPVCFEAGDPADLGLADGCPPEWLRRPELVRLVRTVRKDADLSVAVVGTNDDEIGPRAELLLDQARRGYEPAVAEDATYAGVWPIDPDGAIRQVTWSVGGGRPATTRVSRNAEHAVYLPSYAERRRVDEARHFVARGKAEAAAAGAPGPRPGQSQNTNPFPYS